MALTILLDIIQLGVYFDTFHTENGGGDSKSFVTVITTTLISLCIYSCNSKNVELFSWVCPSISVQLLFNHLIHVCSMLFRMMIINLIAKPLTIALAAVAIFFRSGARIPGLNIGKGLTYM